MVLLLFVPHTLTWVFNKIRNNSFKKKEDVLQGFVCFIERCTLTGAVFFRKYSSIINYCNLQGGFVIII